MQFFFFFFKGRSEKFWKTAVLKGVFFKNILRHFLFCREGT